MAAKAAKAAKRAPRKKGYQMPEPIPAGEILTESKGQWILGKSIGIGGFGEVYSAAPYTGEVPKDYPNVIKIEPHENGPLFVEMHFYMKNCKPDEIVTWQKKKKLTTLGVPRYIASGSHKYKDIKYRFLVIDRYGKDLWKIFEENNRQFPEHIVYKLALQIIDILEYIHHKNYVHADIKSENLLLDLKSYNQVYLVDFGLACRCTTSTKLKADPKKAHNGTLQYTSRDAHMGVPTYRGDIEILSYNMILWLCGSLPWEKLLDPISVQKEKEEAFNNMDNFLEKCFYKSVPQAIYKFMTLLANIEFNEIPPYENLKKVLITGLKNLNHKPDGKLKLNNINAATQKLFPKASPQRIKKPINGVRSSPRIKQKIIESSFMRNPRESTIGVILDKKHCNVKDIVNVLSEMDSDGEYDIQILKKAKKTETTAKVNKIMKKPISLHRKKILMDSTEDDSEDDCDKKLLTSTKRLNKIQKKSVINKTNRKLNNSGSESESESEIVSKGTRSRPATTNITRKIPIKNKLQSKNIISQTDSHVN